MFYVLGLKKLPFEQDNRQIIYTEGMYHPEINDFIRKYYLELRRAFNERSYDFCYIPFMQQRLLNPAIADYYAPYTGKSENDIKLGNDFILDFMVSPENKKKIPPSLLFYSEWTRVNYPEADDQYRGFILNVQDAMSEKDDALRDGKLLDVFTESLAAIVERIESRTLRFMRHSYEVHDDLPIADEDFDYESKQLIKEIQERVDKLHQKGISDAILDRLIHNADKLSRLVITKDLQIELPDYGYNIKMPPLPKAVYFLFLKHREGILFKNLPDYREELSEIYEKLRGGELSERECQSVNDVTNPLNNSINEKCARIREAFVVHFDDRLAHRYYVDGRRGEPKRISLPDNLIEWQ